MIKNAGAISLPCKKTPRPELTKCGKGELPLPSTAGKAGMSTCKTGMWCLLEHIQGESCSKKSAKPGITGVKNIFSIFYSL
jgi:hypothetical protein